MVKKRAKNSTVVRVRFDQSTNSYAIISEIWYAYPEREKLLGRLFVRVREDLKFAGSKIYTLV